MPLSGPPFLKRMLLTSATSTGRLALRTSTSGARWTASALREAGTAAAARPAAVLFTKSRRSMVFVLVSCVDRVVARVRTEYHERAGAATAPLGEGPAMALTRLCQGCNVHP